MKSSDIEPNEHYAAHLGGNAYEIAEVRVRAMGSTPGTVDVEVIHPEGETDDERYDIRTIETKKVLGLWEAQPEPRTRQADHVARRTDPTRPTTVSTRRSMHLNVGEYKTFAEHAADEYAKVVRHNETAARLTEVGIPREQITWLPREGSWGGYDPRKVGTVELSHDELAQLLFLAGNRNSPGQTSTLAYLVSDFHSGLDGFVDCVGSHNTLFEATARPFADAYAADPGPVDSQLIHGPLRVYRVVRD